MTDWLLKLDKELFLFLNGLHSDLMDPVMQFISGKWEWVPLYLLLLFLMFREYRWKGLWLVMFIALLITLSDQITSGLMKPFFERLRPSHEPSLAGLVHIVDGYRGGRYGFASSHASNSFATAVFMFMVLRARHRMIWLLIPWAIMVSYSRIYLGVHYPLDILAGAGIGTLLAVLCYQISLKTVLKGYSAQLENS